SYTYTVKSGTIPTGLILNQTEGRLIGVPTQSGSYTFTIESKDSKNHTGEKQYTIEIYPALTINTSSVTTNWTRGITYPLAVVTASGGFSGNYLFSMNSTNGLSIDSTGKITGKPLTAGTFTYTIQVEDERGFKSSKELIITINEEPKITLTDLVIYLEKGGEYKLTSTGG
ncbi:MAG: Ig domain-containing protein, partial [Bellilinea sp.]|nr:Ig domain-containing protein [Bellilinea sp.]